MNPRLLRTFLAIARFRTATRAATELNLAQSSVSDQIQLLEDELGVRLFLRSKHGFVLTAAGDALVPYAQDLLNIADEALEVVKGAGLSGDRSLVIGTLETVAREVLPTVLAELREQQPELRMRIEVAGSSQVVQRLLEGSNDVALCFNQGELDQRLIRRPFAEEPLILISKRAPKGETPAPALPSLSRQHFIATERGCIYRHLFDQAWHKAGLAPPRPFIEAGSIEAIVRLVAAGNGYAFVPRMAAREALERGAITMISSPEFEHTATLEMIWRRRRVQLPGLALLLAHWKRSERRS